MPQTFPSCQDLQDHVNSLLQLLHQEPSLRWRSHSEGSQEDITTIQASLKKAVSPTFEIVFAGAFSAGKSMLINALLERELLYSAEGHATGTECYIAYAEPEQERVVLTFLSEAEIREQVNALCQRLKLATGDINQDGVRDRLRQECQKIIQQVGGESKSEEAKQAKALMLLLEGLAANRDRIRPNENAIYPMEQFNFLNLKQAAGYARRGSNSAVLKRIEYYCHHSLLQDGNVIIDMPGIDAPVKKDAELAYRKIEDPDTSAVVCVLKPASVGEMSSEETELMEKMRDNPGIRERVFYVFNRIDETWYNEQLRRKLDDLITDQFLNTTKVYKTSGLLGFYGSQIKQTSEQDRFGLDSLFVESVKGLDGREETPQFVSEFNRYCFSGRLVGSQLRPSVDGGETPNENYVRILKKWDGPLIDRLVQDSGIEEFRAAVTRYLAEEKRPQLFKDLADDLQPLCINLRKRYLEMHQELESQPREIEAMKAQELEQLSQDLRQVGEAFHHHIEEQVNQVVGSICPAFEEDFLKLKAKMVHQMDELLDTFSVSAAYSRATLSHPRNATAPLLAILVEAFYSLANELEDILVEASKTVAASFFQRLMDRVRRAEYYRDLYRLLGNDSGIEQKLKRLEVRVYQALESEARTECDRYVRESPRFYDEGTFSIYQFRQTLQQTSQGFDCESMVEAEPAIRQLLKLDFEPKVSTTIRRNFRQTINQTLKTHLLPMAVQQTDAVLQQYSHARAYLEQTLEKEAEEKIIRNQQLQGEIKHKIEVYNQAVASINSCLQAMQLDRQQLPVITESDLTSMLISPEQESFNLDSTNDNFSDLTKEVLDQLKAEV